LITLKLTCNDVDDYKIKRKKVVDRAFIIRLITCYALSFFALLTIRIFLFIKPNQTLFTFKHVFIFALCAIPLSLLYAFSVDKLGSGFGNILLGWTSEKIPREEQSSADLAKARFCKGKGEYKEAISIINEVLKTYPEFPDALLLKGQILWEGFENKGAALKNLEKVIELVQDDDPIRRWAINYYNDIKKSHKIKK
jgi:tetratricopeptide (TPR) repeat protein